jgi:hypothetical protein
MMEFRNFVEISRPMQEKYSVAAEYMLSYFTNTDFSLSYMQRCFIRAIALSREVIITTITNNQV